MPSKRRELARLMLAMTALAGCLFVVSRVSASRPVGERLNRYTSLQCQGACPDRHVHIPARRQKTRPDPTPEDHGPTDAADRVDEEIGPGLSITPDVFVNGHFLSSPALGWSDPAPRAHLFELTRRFRC